MLSINASIFPLLINFGIVCFFCTILKLSLFTKTLKSSLLIVFLFSSRIFKMQAEKVKTWNLTNRRIAKIANILRNNNFIIQKLMRIINKKNGAPNEQPFFTLESCIFSFRTSRPSLMNSILFGMYNKLVSQFHFFRLWFLTRSTFSCFFIYFLCKLIKAWQLWHIVEFFTQKIFWPS